MSTQMKIRGQVVAVAVLPCLVLSIAFSLFAQEKSAFDPHRRALLVGCTKYENLPVDKHLEGAINDVNLVRRTLTDYYRVDPKNIVVLTDEAAAELGDSFLPNRAHIEREFSRLTEQAMAGDQVVIYLSGHGSQAPELEGSLNPEPDGLDEIYLPRDVGQWDGSKGTVPNAIRDDDLGVWLKKIQDKKANVWLIVDACHSGTMTRGNDSGEKLRDLKPDTGLGIPKEALERAQRAAGKTRGGSAKNNESLLSDPGGIVAIYAAQPNEVTLERPMPYRSDDAKQHGLLTYALCEVLTTAAQNSPKPLTYSDLAQGIAAKYVLWGRTFPTPIIEGENRNREILGEVARPAQPRLTLRGTAGDWKVTGGLLQGITIDTILAVLPPAGQGESVVGYVRVQNATTLECNVTPCDFGEQKATQQLPSTGRCKIVQVDTGDFRRTVAVDPLNTEGKPVEESVRQKITAQLQNESPDIQPSFLEFTPNPANAEWLVRQRLDGQWILTSGTGWSAKTGTPPEFGPVSADDRFGSWVQQAVRTIGRAENLKRLAALSQEQFEDAAFSPKVILEVTRSKGLTTDPLAFPNPIIYQGDRLSLSVKNVGRVPADVTLLYIDANYGIDCYFPRNGELNRLSPGDTLKLPGARIDEKTVGQEHLILIALKGEGPQVDFEALAQVGLVKTRAVGGESKSALAKLLTRGLQGKGTTRALSRDDAVDNYTLKIQSWQVEPRIVDAK